MMFPFYGHRTSVVGYAEPALSLTTRHLFFFCASARGVELGFEGNDWTSQTLLVPHSGALLPMLPFAVCSAVGGTICTVIASSPLRQAQHICGKLSTFAKNVYVRFLSPQVLGCAKQKRPRKKKRVPQEWQHEDLESGNSTDVALSQRSKTKREQQDEMQPRFPLLRQGIRFVRAHTWVFSVGGADLNVGAIIGLTLDSSERPHSWVRRRLHSPCRR